MLTARHRLVGDSWRRYALSCFARDAVAARRTCALVLRSVTVLRMYRRVGPAAA
jgi:hypothetical protein